MIEYIEDNPHEFVNPSSSMTAQEVIYLSEDMLSVSNIHQIYTPEDLMLEVA